MSGDFPLDELKVEVEESFNPFDEAFENILTIRGFKGEAHIGLAAAAVIGHYVLTEWNDLDAGRAMRARRGAAAAYLSSIEIDRPFRGSGRGAALLTTVLATLDQRGIAYTYLIPVATSLDGPRDADLRAWYMRFGFQGIAGTRFMVRQRPGVRTRRQVGRIRR